MNNSSIYPKIPGLGRAGTSLSFKKRVAGLGFCLALLLTLSNSLAAKNYQIGRPTPDEIFRRLKRIAQEEVNSKWLIIEKAEFRVDLENKQVIYKWGELNPLGLDENDPYQIPFRMQLYIELHNQAFNSSAIGK